ncbi:hypothetical protein [Nonomuraea sp. NPDC002799]
MSDSVCMVSKMGYLHLADTVHQLLPAATKVRSAPERVTHPVMAFPEPEGLSSVEWHKNRVVGAHFVQNGCLDSSRIFLHASITSHVR